MKIFIKAFTVTLIALMTLFGMVVADANSAYTGFGEEHFALPQYDKESGKICGRVMGQDYTMYFPSEKEFSDAWKKLSGAY